MDKTHAILADTIINLIEDNLHKGFEPTQELTEDTNSIGNKIIRIHTGREFVISIGASTINIEENEIIPILYLSAENLNNEQLHWSVIVSDLRISKLEQIIRDYDKRLSAG